MSQLLKLAQDALNANELQFDMSMLDEKDQDKICLTLKNYKMEKGVSTQIHKVVPVLDPPEDIMEMKEMEENGHSRELDGSNDFSSPRKQPQSTREL